ncbi:MAG: hypothetical protein Q9190_006668 [Brigantiaea leucoxantha]
MPERRSLRTRSALTEEKASPAGRVAMTRPRRVASGTAKPAVTVARTSHSPDEAKRSIHLTVKMPSNRLLEATTGPKRNVSSKARTSAAATEIVSGPRSSRAKRNIIVESESEDEEEDDEDELARDDDVEVEEDDEDEEEDEEEDDEEDEEEEEEEGEEEGEQDEEAEAENDADADADADGDGDVDMEDAAPHPPPPVLKITGPASKPAVSVTPAQVENVKSVEAKEMDMAEDDDDEELSELGSDGDEDAEGEDDDMDQDEEGRSLGDDSRASTPDISKMTKRQRSRLDQVMGGDFLQLPMEPQIKKHLTEEEHVMRRAEMARRRKNLSEKRNEEEKLDTINRLLKKQAPKRRGKISAEEITANALAPPEPLEEEVEKANPVFIRWVSDRSGSRIGVPQEWLQDGLENGIGKVFYGTSNRKMVEEVEG